MGCSTRQTIKRWKRREQLWQKAIAFENKTLPLDRKISRYHAAEMNANDGEYAEWQNESARKLRLTRKLLNISGKSKMIPVAVGIDLHAFRDIFPSNDLAGVGNPYLLCMKALMQQFGEALAEHQPGDQLVIVHDHGDAEALQSDNHVIDDATWGDRHRFVGITSRSSREDIGLQSADLFAYESMRYLDDHDWAGENMRKPLQVLFGLMNRPAFGFHIGRKYLELLRAELEREGKLAPLEKVER